MAEQPRKSKDAHMVVNSRDKQEENSCRSGHRGSKHEEELRKGRITYRKARAGGAGRRCTASFRSSRRKEEEEAGSSFLLLFLTGSCGENRWRRRGNQGLIGGQRLLAGSEVEMVGKSSSGLVSCVSGAGCLTAEKDVLDRRGGEDQSSFAGT